MLTTFNYNGMVTWCHLPKLHIGSLCEAEVTPQEAANTPNVSNDWLGKEVGNSRTNGSWLCTCKSNY